MSHSIPIEIAMAQIDSKYRLVMIAAKRARQLNMGSLPLLNPKSRKPTYISLEEITAGKIAYEVEPLEGMVGKDLLPAEATPTWFRLSTEEALAEGQVLEEEEVPEEEVEEGEPLKEEEAEQLLEVEELEEEEEE